MGDNSPGVGGGGIGTANIGSGAGSGGERSGGVAFTDRGEYVVKMVVPPPPSSSSSSSPSSSASSFGGKVMAMAKQVWQSTFDWAATTMKTKKKKNKELPCRSSFSVRRLLSLGSVSLIYVSLDYWRETSTWISPIAATSMQTLLWSGLGAAALVKAVGYKKFTAEIVLIPRFLLAMAFLIGALAMEVVFVHHVTATMGMTWAKSTKPLPDYGEMLLLWLNDHLPTFVISFLRAPLIGLHHFLMLFLMLAFSVLFGSIRPAGMGIGTRYMTAMGIGRLVRAFVFLGTILPSPRPWCAETRFPYVPNHPHPFIQQYYTPYMEVSRRTSLSSSSNTMDDFYLLDQLLKNDTHVARDTWRQGHDYPPEYRPDWGVFQFLTFFLRPWDPYAKSASGARKTPHAATWFSILRRAGGGCNDLFYSGHVLVATLSAMAFHDAYPGWASKMVWALLAHSCQREIRERHHYTADVLMGVFAGIAIWRMTKNFGWCREEEEEVDEGVRDRRKKMLLRAAKDGDMQRLIDLLNDEDEGWREKKLEVKEWHHKGGIAMVAGTLLLGITVFLLCSGG